MPTDHFARTPSPTRVRDDRQREHRYGHRHGHRQCPSSRMCRWPTDDALHRRPRAARPHRPTWTHGANVLDGDTDSDLPDDAIHCQHDLVHSRFQRFGLLTLQQRRYVQLTRHNANYNFAPTPSPTTVERRVTGHTDTATVTVTSHVRHRGCARCRRRELHG